MGLMLRPSVARGSREMFAFVIFGGFPIQLTPGNNTYFEKCIFLHYLIKIICHNIA